MNNTADVTFTGVAAADDFGIDVASAGDVNGDGYNDVIVGAYLAGVGDIGEAYIYYGGVSMNNTADVTFTNAADTNIGKNIIASADDINSDGYPDLIVGNSSANGANGEAYIYQGSGNRWQSVFAQNFNASRGLQIGDVTLDRYNLLTNNSIFGITTPNWEMDKLGVGSLQDLFVANVITVSGSAEGTSALVLTAGDARVTNGDLIVTSGEASVTSSTTTSDVLALTSMADSTTGDIISITADKVSGTIIDIDISGTPTLTGNLTGMDMDLSTGSIVPGAFDLTALKLTLPSTGTGDHTFAKFIDGTTTLYDFDTTSGIFNVPVSFQSAGDVSLAYDLLFTNTSEAYIKSNGPLTLDIGDPNQNHDLTLKGSGTGSVVVQEDTTDNNTVDTYKGLSVAATSASDTDAVDTISGIYIDATQNDADANVYGIQVANLAGTAGTGVEYGIYKAGTGWDYGLYVEDQAYFGSNVRVGAAATNTDTLNVGGIMSMYQTSGATMTTNFGKLYAKSADSKLYYMNDSGTEYDLTSIGDSDWTISGSNMYSAVAGNVGIGQATPTAKLEVEIASDGGSTGLLVDQKDLDQITAQLANASDATASILDLDVNSVSGDIVNLDWGAAKTQTGALIGTDLDFTNLTTDGTNYLYGLHINDPVSNTASTQYGVYVEGANWDYGIYSASDVYSSGLRAGNIQIGITGDNEIDTSSGNLILDSASGTVQLTDNLDFDGSIIDFSTQNTAFTLIAATNALNIDSNTLVIDASNDRVGIGTNTPTEKLEVAGNINPATTLAYNLGTVAMDTTADVTFTGAGGITNFDSLGISGASAGDVNGDGYNDVIVGAYGYFSFTGQAYIYYGGASMNNTADVTFTGAAVSDYFGGSVASAGDVNGDGFADVIVGAKGADGGGVNRGQAYIYYGGASMNNTADVTFTGAANSDWLGFSVAPAGDVNGDGYADVIVGALYASTNNGQAYIYYGGASMNNTADVTFTGAADNDSFGFSVAPAGDVNGDGYNDVIVGAKDASSTNGQAYIYYGGASMNNTADVTFTGVAAADDFGIDVASAGDVNGDGYNDVIVGAYLAGVGDIGEAYIYYGGVSMNNTADVTFTNAADTNIGKNIIASADDVNGDGYDDVMAISDGSAKVFYGGASMDNTADVTFAGADSVASAGDINSDGYPDLIVGNSSANGANGEAYIYQGSGNRWQSVFAQNFNASRGLQIGDVTLDRYNLLTNNSIFGITTPNWEMDKLGVGSLQDLFVANVITVSGSAEGTSALVLTAGDARVTNGDLIVTSGEASVTSSTTTSDVLALTSMADSTTGDIISITADKVSGTIIDIDISGTPTLTGNLTGMDMDLSTGSIVPGAFDLTALKLTLPSTGTGDHTFAKFIDGTTTLYDFDTTSGIFNVPVSFQSAGD